MELRMYCAYNETRECFLGLEVTAGDFPYKALSREGALTVRANEGLWLTPFRGIPDSGITAPLDLIFLDKECRVIDLVESFPAVRTGAQRWEADTLLALPAHSIVSSDTQRGDQFVLCVPEEMQHRLERLSGKRSDATATPRVARSMAKPLGSGAPGVTAVIDRSEAEGRRSEPAIGTPRLTTRKGLFSAPRNWLQRLLSSVRPNQDRAPRRPAPELAAYYWDGDGVPPTAHAIRDISSTGLYLLTEDRWYTGTLILMSLENKDKADEVRKNVISINARVVRCDRDGVGLQFLAAYPAASRDDEVLKIADRNKVEEFLHLIVNRK